MNDFAGESMRLNDNIESIKEAVDAVSIAVEESTRGVVSVTEMALPQRQILFPLPPLLPPQCLRSVQAGWSDR